MDGKIIFRIIAGIVLVAAVAGIAWFAFNAGVMQNVVSELPQGQPGDAPAPYIGYGMHFWHPFPFYGFGCFGPLLALFLLFIALRAFGILFWGPRWGHLHYAGWHRGGWGNGEVPPMFQEWHDRAHGKPESEKKD